jgi:hypothetical protein
VLLIHILDIISGGKILPVSPDQNDFDPVRQSKHDPFSRIMSMIFVRPET